MNKVLSLFLAVMFGLSMADMPATPTDLEYILGPLEILDGTEEDEDASEPYVYIEILNPERQIYIGDEVTMVCVVIGLRRGEYDIQWQYTDDLDTGEFIDIDCHEHEYTFVADYDNVGYYYRVVVYRKDDFGGKAYQSACAGAQA